MQVFISTSNPNTFKYNGLTYPKNFMCIKQGDSNIAIHNAYDTRFQLLGSTHFSQIQVDGVVHSSQANLMASLSTLLFTKQFNYITQTNQANRLISVGDITVDGNYVTIEPSEWLINGINYETTSNTVLTVPYCATGKNRIDIIIGDTLNQIIRIQGLETTSIAVAPVVPNDTVYITQISVNDNAIGEPEAPVIGDLYITKAQEGVKYHSEDGVLDNIIFDKFTHNLLDGTITEIRGYNFGDGDSQTYVGKVYSLINRQSTNILIKHNSPYGAFRFYLNNNEDYVLKPTETIQFWFTNFGELEQISELPTLQNITDNGNVTTNGIYANEGYNVPNTYGDSFFGAPYVGGSTHFKFLTNGDGTTVPAPNNVLINANADEFISLVASSLGRESLYLLNDSQHYFSHSEGGVTRLLTVDIAGIGFTTGAGMAFLRTNLLTGTTIFQMPATSGTLALLSDITGGTSGTTSELEKVTEASKTGWRLLGQDPANYGNIGINAVDLSTNTFASSTHGATGDYSFASGHNNKASGEGSVAVGNGTNATNYGSFAAGTITTASGYVSSAIGQYNTANSYAETVLGHYASNLTGTTNSIETNETAFRVGVGTDNTNRSDGFRVYNNGSSYFKPFATSGVTGSAGYFGYNSTTNLMAYHNGTVWSDLAKKSDVDSKISKHTGSTYTTNAIQTLTQAEYNAISGSTDANTLYFII